MKNRERKGYWVHKQTGEVFFSLKMLPVIDPGFDRPYELRNERHMRLCNAKEFEEQFVKL